MTRPRKKKDRVLNARIPEELDRELREQAEELDMPVSQLVRNMLHRAVDLVGNLSGNVEHLVTDVVEDVAILREAGQGDAQQAAVRASIKRHVIGWQSIRVNRPSRCALSDAPLAVGDAAHIGIRADGRSGVLVSEASLERLLRDQAPANAADWVRLTLNAAVACARTGSELAAGDTGWLRVGSSPPEIISSDAYDAMFGAGVEPDPDADIGADP